MGIYVPKMKMPECCLLCPFEHMMTCTCDPDERFADTKKRQRPEWCPLIDTAGGPSLIFDDTVLSPNGLTVSCRKVNSITEALKQEEKK